MPFAETYNNIMGATQQQLDEAGLLLDRLEELEVFVNAPSVPQSLIDDSMAEMDSIMDRLDGYLEII